MFEKVLIPAAVWDELNHVDAPAPVRRWLVSQPQWLEIRTSHFPAAIAGLDAGETSAIALALELQADLLLMDDRPGVRAARKRGLVVAGTIGY